MKKRQLVYACLLLITVIALSGCKLDTSKLIHSSKEKKEKLIKVEIVFTDGEKLVTYLKQLGLESDARVYVGGPSTNYYYDVRGNVIGVFNYQRVLYIRLLPEGESNSGGG
ncbi:MAG: hypothetical protein WC109_05665 [Syntrophomonadaceae bacterium]|nr:hypothetical protein [Syntrophomonadaceae bacterium]MDD3272127.1 hypothetical protein [Syntrophomonadaceae bacterium]MDD3898299.1 hypothetical protein [Syntrophomonadaceae bacterium]